MKKYTIGLLAILWIGTGCSGVSKRTVRSENVSATPPEAAGTSSAVADNAPQPSAKPVLVNSPDDTSVNLVEPPMAPWLVENPILLGGYIAGGVRGGVFTKADPKFIAPGVSPYDADITIRTVQLPTQMRLFYADGQEELVTPVRAEMGSNCGGMPMPQMVFKETNEPPFRAVLGMDAQWQPIVRPRVRVADVSPWKNAVKRLLVAGGQPNAPVEIQAVESVDLAGDGTNDIWVFASHIHWKGTCAKNPAANGCHSGSADEAFVGAKSYGLVALSVDGQQPLTLVQEYMSGKYGILELDGWMYADVDGDSTLEFVYQVSYYEGWYSGILKFEASAIKEALILECML